MEEILELVDSMTSEQELFCIQKHIETGEEIRAVFDLHRIELKEYLESLEGFELSECRLQDKGTVEDENRDMV